MHRTRSLVTALLFVMASIAAGISQVHAAPDTATEESQPTPDALAIRKASKAYLSAITRGDNKTLLSLWTKEGRFIDETGAVFLARDLIAARSGPGGEPADPSQLTTETISLRFVTPDVAIEDGTSQWTGPPAGRLARGRYTVVWVRQNGRWLLDTVREDSVPPPAGIAALQDLDWMNGEWAGHTDKSIVLIFCRWSEGKHFLLRSFQVLTDGKVELAGTQRIGWDPVAKRIKSWSFDADGSYGDGTWTSNGDKRTMRTTRTLPDGTNSVTTFVQQQTGEDSFTLERIDGDHAKNGRTITFERKTGNRSPK